MAVSRELLLLIVLVGTLCASPVVMAQVDANMKFRHLTVEDGLPSGSVNCMLQDRQGYIWIGTEGGLCRYDGVRFEYFFHEEHDSLSLSNNFVLALAQDSLGALWVGTYSGLSRFDPTLRSFHNYCSDPAFPALRNSGWVFSLACDITGMIWAGSSAGLIHLDVEHARCRVFHRDSTFDRSMCSDSIYAIAIDNRGFAWLGSDEGLDEVDPATFAVVRHYDVKSNSEARLSSKIVHALRVDSRNNLFIGTYEGLDVLDIGTRVFRRHVLKNRGRAVEAEEYVAALTEDEEKNIWIGGPKGLYRLSNAMNDISHLRNSPYDPQSLLSDQVISLLCDAGGTLWVGTRKGLSIYSPYANKFRCFQNIPGNANSLKNNRVWSFCLDEDEQLWVGTTMGVDVLRFKDRSFNHRVQDTSVTWGITQEFVLPILRDRAGTHWFGTWTSGLVKMDLRRQFRRYTIAKSDVDFRGIISLLEDSRGRMWVGTRRGLFLFDEKTGAFSSHDQAFDLRSVEKESIHCLLEDQGGDIWIGTDRELIRLDYERGAMKRTRSAVIYCLFQPRGRSESLVVGTVAGIDIRSTADPTVRTAHYGLADGLPSYSVLGILEDAAGILWFSTLRGLVKFNLDTKSLRVYDVQDGLPGNEFNQLAFLKGSSGEMFFGGNNGFIRFFPSELRDNPHIPPVVIKKFRVFERGGREDFLVSGSSQLLDLSYSQNTFSFEFAALDFAMPERNHYAIMLEGFEREWRPLESDQRSEMYTNLDPGEYTLRVKGSNGDGVWNDEGASVQLIIRPPFWAAWYFRGGMAIGVVLLAASFYTHRIKKVAERNAELELKVQERTRELHHSNEELSLYRNTLETQVKERTLELERIVMTLQAEVSSRERIQRELISYQKDLQHLASDLSKSEERERRRIATFLHDVVGQTLFFCKMKLGSMTDGAHASELLKVHGLVQDLLNQVQSLTFDLSPPVLYELGLDEAIVWLIEQMRNSHSTEVRYTRTELPHSLSEEARFVVFTAARELLTNALKHSQASRIDIGLLVDEPGLIRLSVGDDGRGFDAEQLLSTGSGRKRGRGGFGLFNVRERLTFLGGTVRIESSAGRGTHVELTLPLKRIS